MQPREPFTVSKCDAFLFSATKRIGCIYQALSVRIGLFVVFNVLSPLFTSSHPCSPAFHLISLHFTPFHSPSRLLPSPIKGPSKMRSRSCFRFQQQGRHQGSLSVNSPTPFPIVPSISIQQRLSGYPLFLRLRLRHRHLRPPSSTSSI